MFFLKQNRLYHRVLSILLSVGICLSLTGALALVGLCDEESSAESAVSVQSDAAENSLETAPSDENNEPFYIAAFVSFKDFAKTPIGMICLAAAFVVLLIIIIFIIQWRRVVRRKKNPKEVDWSLEARQSIEYARQLLETGILKALRSEFGNTAPSDSLLLQKFITDAYGMRSGGLYISVDSLSAFVRQIPNVFLQGADSIGGESVLTLLVNESSDERFFYLEGLLIGYRAEGYRHTTRYNIRFSLEKSNRPIEEVLEFEVVQ